MEQDVDVVGHNGVGVDLHAAELRHTKYLVDDVGLVRVVEHHGPAHAARTHVVEALALVLQSQFPHVFNSLGVGASDWMSIFPVHIKSFQKSNFHGFFRRICFLKHMMTLY